VKTWTNSQLQKGLSKFIKVLSDLVSDSPDLPQWLFKIVMKPLLESKRISLNELEWL
jgi:hypothetical protein